VHVMRPMKIAVVDDDPDQVELILQTLGGLGHVCQGFGRGRQLLRQLRRETFDALILDWQLPDVGGPQIVVWVRSHIGHDLPILFVTNRSSESDLIEALSCGADDYLVKPVRRGELAARVAALLRRSYPVQRSDVDVFGTYSFDSRRRVLLMGGVPVELKLKEYELAHLLFSNLGRLLSRNYLLERVWGHESEGGSRSLDTHVSSLRRKLHLRGDSRFQLGAVYGLGYRLEQVDSDEGAPHRPDDALGDAGSEIR